MLHHAAKPHLSLFTSPLTSRLRKPGRVAQRLISQRRLRHGGNRSDVSAKMMHRWLSEAGLTVESQTDSWGAGNRSNVKRFGDMITVARKPPLASGVTIEQRG